MSAKPVRVADNGHGVIDKRVADAVRFQPDMELVGVSDMHTDCRFKAATILDLPFYAAPSEESAEMRAAGIPIVGTIEDLIAQADVAVHGTPKGGAARNLGRYRAAGVGTSVLRGEQRSLSGHSSVAQASYETALGRDATESHRCYHVDNLTIVIPETIDAIRVLTRTVADGAESNRTTDRRFGVWRGVFAVDLGDLALAKQDWRPVWA